MRGSSSVWALVGVAFATGLLADRLAFAEESFVVEGVKGHDGEHLEVDLWKNDLAAKVCEVDTLTLLYGQGSQVDRDEAGQPVSCGKEKVAKLAQGTRVEEIAPSDSCNTRHPAGSFRRVRVLDGPEAGKSGCVNASALAHKASP